jgi:Glycosyl transferases group 1
MNILMLCAPHPNYVPDLLLHGMRKLFGDSVVDFPRKDCIYDGICGQPNLDRVPGLMADDAGVDRDDVGGKLAAGFYDFVLCDVRAFNAQLGLLQNSRCPLAVIDGEDFAARINPGPYVILRRETDGNDFSIPLPMALPEEVLDWIDRHADTPKTHSIGFLGSRSKYTPDRNAMLDEIARQFPDSLVNAWEMEGQWHGREGYYHALQSCKLVLNLPGAGLDTFRYWENAACNSAHIAKRMDLLIPHDFRDGREILRFDGLRELSYKVEQVMSDRLDWRDMAGRSREWLRAHHTTLHRARQTIDRLKIAFCRA